MIKDNHKKFKELRKDYTFFVYEGLSINDNKDALKVIYDFNLADQYSFNPTLTFNKAKFLTNKLTEDEIQNFIFHIGMVELISYWKAACPPKIIIKPFKLDNYQINWWKKVYYNGLGEFFYLNNILIDQHDFVSIECQSEKKLQHVNVNLDTKKLLVPIGGGKDSVVTLELLKNEFESIPLILNPRQASIDTLVTAGYAKDEFIKINRTIHPTLIELNNQGFLNGHTPFSALLAFTSVFAAAMSGSKHIALSNESSANEPTDKISGVNHQYSKSIEFEKDFREYVAKNISEDLNYFSFLRPLSEYTIARLFSSFPNHFKSFKSCNVGSKTDTWCGNCSKCLFTFIILSPFIERDILIEIFGKDLYDDKSLSKYFDELIGLAKVKPFECVGTIDEVNLAIREAIKKTKDPLPYLLYYYTTLSQHVVHDDASFNKLDDGAHYLEKQFLEILKESVE